MGEKNYFAYGDAETVLTEFADDIKNKVDKVSGKGLSTNDFTTAEKNKLAGIENAANKTTVDTALSSTSKNPLQNKAINSALSNKVDKVSGKGLSTNDYTTNEKNKLAGIASGAEVNVQSDWSVTTTTSDAYIKNKPTSLPASDVSPWAKASTKPSYTKSEIGLGNVDNTSDVNKPISTATQAALDNRVMYSNTEYLFPDKGLDGINIDDLNQSYTVGITASGHGTNPPMSWQTVANLRGGHFLAQIALNCSPRSSTSGYSDMYIRDRYAGSDYWCNWTRVFTNGNCTVELDVVGTSNNNGTFYNNAIKFPNGLCIQWGRHTNMPNGTAVYFKYAYSYRPTVTFANGQGYAANDYAMTWFNDGALSSNVDWMAIGYIS